MTYKIVFEMGNIYTNTVGNPRIIAYLRSLVKAENDINAWESRPWLRYTFFIEKNGRFLTGLLPQVIREIKEQDRFHIEYEIKDIRDRSGFDLEPENMKQRLEEFPYTPRPYQQDALNIGIKRSRGFFVHPPGAGKTVLMAALIASLDVVTVILCGKRDLAKQLQRELSSYTGKSVGLVGSGVVDIQKYTVVMVQSLGKRAKPEVKELLANAKYLCVDEAHHVQAPTWTKACNLAVNAVYRHGFTATLFTSKISVLKELEDGRRSRSTEQKSIAYLVGPLGPVLHRMTLLDVIGAGFLSKPTVYQVPYIHGTSYEEVAGIDYGEEYEIRISENEERNTLVASIVQEELKEDDSKNFILFVNRIAHGDLLKEEIHRVTGLPDEQVAFIHGENSKRDQIIEQYIAGEIQVLIGTSVIGEGLNLFCDIGIQCAAGLSDIDAIQRLGRVLRIRKKEGEKDVDPTQINRVKYYDIADGGHPFFTRHTKSRMEQYSLAGFDAEEKDFSYLLEKNVEDKFDPTAFSAGPMDDNSFFNEDF